MKQTYYKLRGTPALHYALTLVVAMLTTFSAWAQTPEQRKALARVVTSSTMPNASGTEWPEDIQWQFLTIHQDRYPLVYVDGQTAMPLSDRTYTLDDSRLWAFVGSHTTGYRIYNKAAGPSKILSAPANNENTGRAILKPITSLGSGDIQLWDIEIQYNDVRGAFHVYAHGNRTMGLNRRDGFLGFWRGRDGGSSLLSSPVNATAKPTEAIRMLTTPLSTAALAANIKAGGRFIFHERFVGGYMYDDGARGHVQIKESNPVPDFLAHLNYVWELVATAEANVFKVKNVATGRFVQDQTTKEAIVSLNASDASAMLVQVVIDQEHSRVAIRRKDAVGSEVLYFHGFGSNGGEKTNHFVVYKNSGALYDILPVQTAALGATPFEVTVSHQGRGTNNVMTEAKAVPGKARIYANNVVLPAFLNPILTSVTSTLVNGTENPTTLTANGTATLTYDLPFDLTTDLASPVWQGMQLGKTTKLTLLAHTDGSKVNLNASASAAARITDPSLWAIMGNLVDGFKLYNKSQTTSKLLYAESRNNGEFVKFGEPTNNNVASKSSFFLASHGEGFVVYQKNGNGRAHFNNYSGGNVVRYWYQADDGSMVFFTNQAALLNAAKSTIASALDPYSDTKGSGYIGSLSTTDYDQLRNEATAGLTTLEAFETWNNNVKAKQVTYKPNRFYHIIFAGNTGKRMMADYTNAGGVNTYTSTSNEVAAMWMLSGNAEAVKISNPNTGKYNAYVGAGLYANNHADANSAPTCKLVLGNKPMTRVLEYGLSKYVGLNNMGEATSSLGQSVQVTAPQSQFYLKEVTTYDVTITDAGYATMKLPFAVTLPSDLTAQILTAVTTNAATLTDLVSNLVPANTPVVLKGAAKTYTLTIAYDDNTPAPVGNLLDGVTAPGTLNEADYFFAKPSAQGAGFYRTEVAKADFGPNKAILRGANAQPASGGAPAAVLLFDNTVTSIAAATANAAATTYYNLQGQRVDKPTRGIYITSEGKKVVIR